MNRGKNFNKLSGGYSLGKIKDSLKIIEPVLEDAVLPTIIPAIAPKTEIVKTKVENKDPAHRLRKLALKAKKVMVQKKAQGGKYKHGTEPEGDKLGDEGAGRGLGNYLNTLPKNILAMVSDLHNGNMLVPILKIAKHF
jgi:hypothetical protein